MRTLPRSTPGGDGTPAGFFVELLDEMAAAEGWDLRYVPCVWEECLEMLQRGDLDLMPDVAYSAERDRTMDFHKLQVVQSWSQVYARRDLPVTSLADLNGKRVAMLEGGIQQKTFNELMTKDGYEFETMAVGSLDDAYSAVAEGRADAVVTNRFFASRNLSEDWLRETPIIFQPSALYYATPTGKNADLGERIDGHLSSWRTDPESIYFDSLRRTLTGPGVSTIPRWLGWSFLALAGTVGLAALMVVILRRQVAQRTRDLLETSEALEDERSHLEVAVAARTAELEASKQEAERLSEAKSDFLADVSHEIRNPMNVVMGMLELASAEELPEQARRDLSVAQSSARSLLHLLGDILDFERIRAGRLRIDGTEFDISQVLGSVEGGIGHQAREKGLDFEISCAPDLTGRFVGDPHRLEQVIVNLCGNAIKFTEEGRVVLDLTCMKVGATHVTLQVSVTDSGIGMTPEQQSGLFDRFAQASGPSTPGTYGAGLGLPICKGLVESMGGRIWVESSLPGVGTTMCFEVTLGLPAPERESAPSRESSAREAPGDSLDERTQLKDENTGGDDPGGMILDGKGSGQPGLAVGDVEDAGEDRPDPPPAGWRSDDRTIESSDLAGASVLVVEDNEMNRKVFSRMLRSVGVEVDEAANGQEALEMVTSREYDAVLMDLQMPKMDGFEASGRIRRLAAQQADEHLARLPIIAITGMSASRELERSRQVGIDAHVKKPIDVKELKSTLARLIRSTPVHPEGPVAGA